MKTLTKLLLLATITISNFGFQISNCYAQYPFYGNELSNYEVGDSLEYNSQQGYQGSPGGGTTYYQDLYVITKKEIVPDSGTAYTVLNMDYMYVPFYTSSHRRDSFRIVISNDTVYNNTNNLLGYLLNPFDTTGLGGSPIPDSNYVRFDTVNGEKKLVMEINSYAGNQSYEAVQNIGLIDGGIAQESGYFSSVYLVYAHLAHYGIFGAYESIYDGVNGPAISNASSTIRYDDYGNAWLLLQGNNVQQPILGIYDLLGRKLKSQLINTGSNLIDMNNLAAGMYLYRVENGEAVIGTGKLFNGR